MRSIFFGTPEIAVPALEALAQVSAVSAVVCQPDRPAGRGLELRPPAVKARALELGLPVVQPEKIRTEAFAQWVREREADVALVMAYGRILPPAVLAATRTGFVNLHASLLPRWRGAAPIQWAVASGDRETGISLMQVDEGCDTGPVLCRRAIEIGEDETAGELSGRLARLAAEVVLSELELAVAGELRAEPQNEALATKAPMLEKAHGRIDWSLPAGRVHDHVRGMTPWPGAHTTARDRSFKVLATRLAADTGHLETAGTVVRIGPIEAGGPIGALVACGGGAVWLLRGQVEGRKALGAAELAAGRAIAAGLRLGV